MLTDYKFKEGCLYELVFENYHGVVLFEDGKFYTVAWSDVRKKFVRYESVADLSKLMVIMELPYTLEEYQKFIEEEHGGKKSGFQPERGS